MTDRSGAVPSHHQKSDPYILRARAATQPTQGLAGPNIEIQSQLSALRGDHDSKQQFNGIAASARRPASHAGGLPHARRTGCVASGRCDRALGHVLIDLMVDLPAQPRLPSHAPSFITLNAVAASSRKCFLAEGRRGQHAQNCQCRPRYLQRRDARRCSDNCRCTPSGSNLMRS